MRWQDKGYLLSLNKYNQNSAIAEFFTENNGKISGVIFGATSKKIKNYLLIGNKFHLNINFKQDASLGYFKVEIDEIKTPLHFDNKKKLFCIIYTMNLVKILTVENQENESVYNLLGNFFFLLKDTDWLIVRDNQANTHRNVAVPFNNTVTGSNYIWNTLLATVIPDVIVEITIIIQDHLSSLLLKSSK